MEPTSSAVSAGAAMGAVTITSVLPGVNGDALIGAFAGAVVFALHARDITIPKRLVYMLVRSEEHTSELQSRENLVCRLLLEKKKQQKKKKLTPAPQQQH